MIKQVNISATKFREVDESRCLHKTKWEKIDEDEISKTYQLYCPICGEYKENFKQEFND